MLIDTGATGRYVQPACPLYHLFPKRRYQEPQKIRFLDGTTATLVTEYVEAKLDLGKGLKVVTQLDVMAYEALRECDHKIKLIPGAELKPGPIYQLDEHGDAFLKQWINDGLASGHLRRSKLPYGSPVFLVPQKGGNSLSSGNRLPGA
ncbi:hypothetical protein TREMEDRAFT_59609 [Tremella mesenterica DSM 1558]|uniref:uncharacterized protein n=1 Tax=Tremella mesenterica (strain ATCC 24925 / CBS 8224 / DSM 1558 / NBRC 9311 / NRRL Y-6157 / RJB 2259-6 / UBC 559-6) TaxID=578456 RepID=UPI0003F4941B|nr:uncharacterized protein TREMEDRAFT_59609 [Tremella mesenterica DSM 1558]EIW73442.1 hypothetical protein TREMEDRAFT_59609 [Tremella mesenterica DSM 1558]